MFQDERFDVNAQEEADYRHHIAATNYANSHIDQRMEQLTTADLVPVTHAIDAATSAGEMIVACVNTGMSEDLMAQVRNLVREQVWQELYSAYG